MPPLGLGFGLSHSGGAPYVPPAPTTTVSVPVCGPTAVGTPVTLTGTNFTGATGVTFGGTAATSVVVVSATSITCVAPAHAAGLIDIVVTTPGGTGTLTNGYRFITEQRAIHARAYSAGTWTDLSGNAHNVASPSAPTLAANSVNTNRSSVVYDGVAVTGNYSQSVDATALAQAYTIYMVAKIITWTSGLYMFDGGGLNTGACLFQTATPGFDLYAGDGLAAHNTDATAGTWRQIWIEFNDASSSIQVGSAGTPTTGDAGALGIAGVTIGAYGGPPGNFSNIAIGEMIWMSGIQSSGVKTSLLANGVAYWGVA